MKTAALISEFNPFHNGHLYCVSTIRERLGEDTCIIALMSGNYTQRGDVAIVDKFTRAAMAIEGGCDLVLEIPFPFSVSSAEYYAKAGVGLAASLGIVDTLAFGSECGDIDALCEIASHLSSTRFLEAFLKATREEEAVGHAKLTELVYARLFSEEKAALLTSPNNTLAIEYLRANAALPSPLATITIKRRGSYHGEDWENALSATAIRAAIHQDPTAAVAALPKTTAAFLSSAMACGNAPAELSRLGTIFLSFFRTAVFACEDDVAHRLRQAAKDAATFEDFISLSATKRYTNAHLRRALFHRYFGITSADLQEAPAYTQVLGMNSRGQAALRRAAKASAIPILTKPADARDFVGTAAKQAALSQKADLLYPLAMPKPTVGNAAMRTSPYRKK